ncbi:MAG: phospho-sugar mutase [Oscillibacter sp.]|nr:phospho-sugar mutase [Oscillibacter sp.]
MNETYQLWLEKLDKASPLYQELLDIQGNETEITERFYRDIEFGTAGLRGICGAGTNRMNDLTVGRATQGIANYILKSGQDPKQGVAIAYDCRHHSKEFSEMAAEIFAGNGIRAYLFPSLRPTPELSYAVRKLGAVSGVNMTASHNPKEYNGYKVYWNDGAQISGEVSNGILAEIQKLDMFGAFPRVPLAEAVSQGLVVMLGEEMDRDYLRYVLSLAQRPDAELDLDTPIVYTPLNGAGSVPMMEMAKARGFRNFTIVPEQKDPDPDFKSVPFPNPENPKAFAVAEEIGRRAGAEVLIATDPDSDRMAIEVSDGKGGYVPLNGNQTGGLLIAYLAESQKRHGTLPEKAAMIQSIVTGDFGRTVCESYGIKVYEALTGFKNICGRIPELQADGYTYFFGYEESIGCAPGEEVRDKDGISAGMLVSEMAAYYRKNGIGLLDALDRLYQKYGYFSEDQVSVVLQGKAGQERIGRIMDAFRNGAFGARNVAQTIDYINGYRDIPPQNALKYVMTDGSWFAMRPSGTEPKIKFYYYAVDRDKNVSRQRVADMVAAVSRLIDGIE